MLTHAAAPQYSNFYRCVENTKLDHCAECVTVAVGEAARVKQVVEDGSGCARCQFELGLVYCANAYCSDASEAYRITEKVSEMCQDVPDHISYRAVLMRLVNTGGEETAKFLNSRINPQGDIQEVFDPPNFGSYDTTDNKFGKRGASGAWNGPDLDELNDKDLDVDVLDPSQFEDIDEFEFSKPRQSTPRLRWLQK